jgi:hypothetical protein
VRPTRNSANLEKSSGTVSGNYAAETRGSISFHSELREKLPSVTQVAGPYWALNIVLWARGIVQHAAIGLAGGYQYHVSGGQPNQPKVTLPLPPLRRRATVGNELKEWLSEALGRIDPGHPMTPQLSSLNANYAFVSRGDAAREELARFYADWISAISNFAPAGRALALYQDLSLAYAFGKSLPPLPRAESPGRRPESVAETLMLSCL